MNLEDRVKMLQQRRGLSETHYFFFIQPLVDFTEEKLLKSVDTRHMLIHTCLRNVIGFWPMA